MIRAALAILGFLAALIPPAAAQTAATTATAQLTETQRKLNLETFEYVWTTVRDKHWQAKPAGLDWQAVHDELRPAMEKASSMDAARAVLHDMLGRLHQTHFAIIPSDLYSDLGKPTARGEITTGIDVRVPGATALLKPAKLTSECPL